MARIAERFSSSCFSYSCLTELAFALDCTVDRRGSINFSIPSVCVCVCVCEVHSKTIPKACDQNMISVLFSCWTIRTQSPVVPVNSCDSRCRSAFGRR